jgi:hypothetical protein
MAPEEGMGYEDLLAKHVPALDLVPEKSRSLRTRPPVLGVATQGVDFTFRNASTRRG